MKFYGIKQIVEALESIKEELKRMTDEQRTALLAADASTKQAVADVATRVLAKLNELQGKSVDPDVDTIIADMKADVTALQAIAPTPAPAPNPTPGPPAA